MGQSPTIAEIAQGIRRQSKLRTEDAVHLATAKHIGCDVLLTNDGDTEGSKRRKLLPLDGKHGVRICTPKAYLGDKWPMFGEQK